MLNQIRCTQYPSLSTSADQSNSSKIVCGSFSKYKFLAPPESEILIVEPWSGIRTFFSQVISFYFHDINMCIG